MPLKKLLNGNSCFSIDAGKVYVGVSFMFSVSIILLFFCTGSFGGSRMEQVKRAFRGYKGRYLLYINKSEFILCVYNRDYRVISKYKVGYGLNPDRKTKLYEGDERTPEGYYRVTEKLSMNADKRSKKYKKLKTLNDRYLRAEDGHHKFGYPNVDTGKNAYGPRLFWLDYPNKKDNANYARAVKNGLVPIKDRKLTGIGFGITIHGNNDPPSIGQLSSAGCILLYNRDVIELDKYVHVGTPVIIGR